MYNDITATDRILKVKEVAEILSISKSMVYKVIDNGELPVLRLGNLVRVRTQDVKKFIEDHVSQNNTFEE